MTLTEVLEFATKAHSGKLRKASTGGVQLRYLIHPISVTKRLWDWGIHDETILKAALCHDILEETVTSCSDLLEAIGIESYRLVDDLTFEGIPQLKLSIWRVLTKNQSIYYSIMARDYLTVNM